MKAGRPSKWSSPEELSLLIEKYFKECKENSEVPTISGLAYAIGTNRQTLLNYENCLENDKLKKISETAKQAYTDIIKSAKCYIESRYEQSLFDRSKTTGAIFSLKNNFDWKDKQEVVQTTGKSVDLSGLSVEEIHELLNK